MKGKGGHQKLESIRTKRRSNFGDLPQIKQHKKVRKDYNSFKK